MSINIHRSKLLQCSHIDGPVLKAFESQQVIMRRKCIIVNPESKCQYLHLKLLNVIFETDFGLKTGLYKYFKKSLNNSQKWDFQQIYFTKIETNFIVSNFHLIHV